MRCTVSLSLLLTFYDQYGLSTIKGLKEGVRTRKTPGSWPSVNNIDREEWTSKFQSRNAEAKKGNKEKKEDIC